MWSHRLAPWTTSTVATPLAFQIVAPGNKSLGATIGDLINSINADKDLGAKAAHTSSGHLIISSPSGSGLSISGTEAVFGDWTDVIEGPYSVFSSIRDDGVDGIRSIAAVIAKRVGVPQGLSGGQW